MILSDSVVFTDDERRRPDVFSALKLGQSNDAELNVNSVFFASCHPDLCEIGSPRKFAVGQRDPGGGPHPGELVQSGGGVAPHDGGGEWPAGSGAAHGGEERRH